jgi:transposase InsO family protein
MTSKTVAALLSDLEVTRSHSRPRVSNDNPYSEALFKTLKYGPEFPERFASVHDAGTFISGFVDWYNCEACFSPSGTGWQDRDRPIRPVDVTLGTTDPKVSFCGPVRPRRWSAGARPAHHGSLIRRMSTPCGA